MKTFVLAAVNAKFIHSSLAVRSLARFAHNRERHHLITAEFTINQTQDYILDELFRMQPEVLFFSAYIWNIEVIRQLCPDLKKILPDCLIALGGPEVSYESRTFLRDNPAVDLILRGEGELTFTELLDQLEGEALPAFEGIKGIAYRNGDEIEVTPNRDPLDLALLPFPYDEGCKDAGRQILYYESSRGCPYRCAYCLSSVEKAVRFAPLDKVFADLQRFLDARVPQVKFVDRTFNCDRNHTLAIWRYLAEHDNGITNFHFELTADLLDDEMIAFLRSLRPGLFQFEIGVQSTNPQTLLSINRNVSFDRLARVVRAVKSGGNIHQHLDLIAGLPQEDYRSFGRSFDDVYALQPEQLQLGFLKVLKGSPLHARREEFGIVYRDCAPYEVLATRWLPHEDVMQLSAIEEMVELFYNSGKFIRSIAYLTGCFPSPFACYESLAQFWVESGYHRTSHSRLELCELLRRFVLSQPQIDEQAWMWRLKFDLSRHERPKKLPDWLHPDQFLVYRERILAFFSQESNLERYLPQYLNCDCRYIAKVAYIEVFGNEGENCQAVLFDYDRRDLLGNATYYLIEL
ncbi:B12-binding domain-containing radical SAM protein [Ligaoa zhengdingensis]|uniref:B12-binding domain-containing radical SAM protein n=1 Tax=Ligaoa zhengdingensis TaxID=2763658 RepID=UPI0031BA3158